MNIGLVLSGGMAKGSYEAGALKAISEYLPPEQIKYISSASVGVINSYAFSCGAIDKAVEVWKNINQHYPKLFVKTVLGSDHFKTAVKDIAVENIFAEKFYVSLFNFSKRKNCYININDCEEELREKYLLAALALPPVTKPVIIKDDCFVDGGMVDNIPVYPLLDCPLDYIICIHFDKYDYSFESPSFDKKTIKIVFNDDSEILRKSVWFTREGVEQMLEDGYKKAKRVLEYVFSEGIDNKTAVYERIEFLNSLKPKKQARFTCDIVYNDVSKIARRIAKTEVVG